MALIGHARVSTEDQITARQLNELHASGGDYRGCVVLAQTIARLQPGHTLVVVLLDRLARLLSHLLEVIEGPQGRGRSTTASRILSTRRVHKGSSY
jgi:DNA invertase Pin-like site-specific DNA recombinase